MAISRLERERGAPSLATLVLATNDEPGEDLVRNACRSAGTELEIDTWSASRTVPYGSALFAGHSLRAVFLIEAGRQGANLFKMKNHSRRKSIEMVSEYVRDYEAFRDHAGDKFL